MRPTRECTLVDLLDRILDKGVLLNADVIISVAGVPLIGVNLRAALAGIETMLDYGMMEAWDQSIREYYSKHYAKQKQVPLGQGEEIILRTFGSHWYSEGIYSAWRPGFLYLTNKRLLLFRKEPAQILFEAPLNEIEGLTVKRGMHLGEEREELCVLFDGGNIARIRTQNLVELRDAIEQRMGKPLVMEITIPREELEFLTAGEEILQKEKAWYLFPSGIMGETWKPGRLYITNKRLLWSYQLDNRILFEVPIENIGQAVVGKEAPEVLRERLTSDGAWKESNPVMDKLQNFDTGKPGSVAKFGPTSIARKEEEILIISYKDGVASFSGRKGKLDQIKTTIEKMGVPLEAGEVY